VRLLERSTRSLRLTDTGADILQQAQRGAELNEAVESIVSNTLSDVSGTLRLSAPPNISDTLVVPLVRGFQAAYPKVRITVFVTPRMVDPITDGVDLALRVGELADSSLVARRLLHYRHLLVASPDYLAQAGSPHHPRDLLNHRIVAFSAGTPERQWLFTPADEASAAFTLSVTPHLAMNDYSGVAAALLTGGIGDLPPIVRTDLLRDGRLVEVMPGWRFPMQDLSLVHLSNRQVSRPVRLFKAFAVGMAAALFPELAA